MLNIPKYYESVIFLYRTIEYGTVVESMLENALTNIVAEAFQQEFNISAPLRLVALPPRPSSAKH